VADVSALKDSKNMTIVAMVVVAVLAFMFWKVLLSPKREEAADLGQKVELAQASLAQHEAEAVEGEEARDGFPVDYQTLVVLGKAVPGDDDTASLLAQISHIARDSKVRFQNIELASGGGSAESEETSVNPGPGEESVPPSEVAAAVMPLGASVGPAGLGAMPYSLIFKGDFFRMADFIQGLDALVKTEAETVAVDGRLLTIDGFSLSADSEKGFPALEATFGVTTYVTPPEQGVTAGASPESPAGATATPAAATLGGAP
jgi:Tfp pilus assembly protein PilO